MREGLVQVSLRPVRDQSHVADLVTKIATIPGLNHVQMEQFDGVVARTSVHLTEAIDIVDELRRVLGQDFDSHRLLDDRLDVTLLGSAAGGSPGDRAIRGPATSRSAGPGAREAPPAVPAPPDGPSALPLAIATAAADLTVAALHFSPDVSVVVFDRSLRYRAAAGAAHPRMEYRNAQIIGRRAEDVLPPSTWATLATGHQAAIQGATVSIDWLSEDGVTTWESTFSPVFVDSAVAGGMLVARNTSIRQPESARITELGDVLAMTFDSSPVPQALLTTTGQWTKVNRALCGLLGWDESDLLYAPCASVTHPDDRQIEAALMDGVSRGTRAGYDLRKRFIRPDGSSIDTTVHVRRAEAASGALRGYVMHVAPARGE